MCTGSSDDLAISVCNLQQQQPLPHTTTQEMKTKTSNQKPGKSRNQRYWGNRRNQRNQGNDRNQGNSGDVTRPNKRLNQDRPLEVQGPSSGMNQKRKGHWKKSKRHGKNSGQNKRKGGQGSRPSSFEMGEAHEQIDDYDHGENCTAFPNTGAMNQVGVGPQVIYVIQQVPVPVPAIADNSDLPPELQPYPELRKFWNGRYNLFSKYDKGILLDPESWYSVTPELVAQQVALHSDRFANGTVLDAFCGCGGNTIQFALRPGFDKVIAIDIDHEKRKMCEHNAKIYGVEDKIKFLTADFFEIAPNLGQIDVVFLSPPWGGMNYGKQKTFDIRNMGYPQCPMNGEELFRLAQTISPNIVFYLPKNVEIEQVNKLAGEGNPPFIQRCKSKNGKLKGIAAYFGSLALKKDENDDSNLQIEEDDINADDTEDGIDSDYIHGADDGVDDSAAHSVGIGGVDTNFADRTDIDGVGDDDIDADGINVDDAGSVNVGDADGIDIYGVGDDDIDADDDINAADADVGEDDIDGCCSGRIEGVDANDIDSSTVEKAD